MTEGMPHSEAGEEFEKPFPGGYKTIQERALEMIDERIKLAQAVVGPNDSKIADLEGAKTLLSEPYVLYKADQNGWEDRRNRAEDINETDEALAKELADSVLNLN